ncbi:MAG: hypothetical protein LBI39_03755 [Puniceicoccales bacterium]|jgi:hypothetical protein|nr:hypothetical protein [Puniceicoccales bacterium]
MSLAKTPATANEFRRSGGIFLAEQLGVMMYFALAPSGANFVEMCNVRA